MESTPDGKTTGRRDRDLGCDNPGPLDDARQNVENPTMKQTTPASRPTQPRRGTGRLALQCSAFALAAAVLASAAQSQPDRSDEKTPQERAREGVLDRSRELDQARVDRFDRLNDDQKRQLKENFEKLSVEDMRNMGYPDSWIAREFPDKMVEIGIDPADILGGNGDEGDAMAVLPEGDETGFFADADGMVEINLTGEVRLITLLNLIADGLNLNIFADPQVESGNHSVYLKAPIKIPVETVLPLIRVLLEDKGFIMTQDEDFGWYRVSQLPDTLPDPRDPSTRIIPTQLIRPSTLKALLENALANSGQQAIRITSIDELGVLMVTGGPRILSNVEDLIAKFASIADGQQFHRFPLSFVNASYAQTRILEFNGLGASGGVRPGVATNPGTGAPSVPSGALINLEGNLLVDHGNALIFKGTFEEAEQVARWIELVDKVTSLVTKRYAAGKVLYDVIGAAERLGLGTVSESGVSTTGTTNLGGINTQRNNALTPTQSSTSSVTGSHFSVDYTEGSFVYSGTPEQHEIVADLVQSFRETVIDNRVELHTYQLDHAKAGNLAELLKAIVEEQQALGNNSALLPNSRQNLRGGTGVLQDRIFDDFIDDGETTEDGPLADVNSETSTIVADGERNQLIIKATARDHRTFARLIRELDRRQPQVHVRAQIVSVTTLDNFDWAVDLQINEGDFLAFTSFGLGAPGMVAEAARIVPGGLPGLTSAVIKDDYVPYIFNMLESVGDTRIVSAPELLVAPSAGGGTTGIGTGAGVGTGAGSGGNTGSGSNTSASVSSTRREPYAEISQGNATTVQGQGGEAQAGTKLDISDLTISSGGFVNFQYTLELSSFDFGGQVANLAPPTQEELYTSTVTVPSGSTIVVGGLRLERESDSVDRLPILGEIPFLGALFRNQSTRKSITTIYVFITPTIQADEYFRDLILLTEGPARDMGIDTDRIPLKPIRIGLSREQLNNPRLLPTNQP